MEQYYSRVIPFDIGDKVEGTHVEHFRVDKCKEGFNNADSHCHQNTQEKVWIFGFVQA